jgi:hypothetical protein
LQPAVPAGQLIAPAHALRPSHVAVHLHAAAQSIALSHEPSPSQMMSQVPVPQVIGPLHDCRPLQSAVHASVVPAQSIR